VFIDNKLYSSGLYHEMPRTVERFGHTVLSMVGDEHARHRAAVLPMMLHQRAIDWWKGMWIEQLVDTLVSDFAGEGRAELNQQLCARLPMHTVTNALGLTSGEALDFRDNLIRSMSPAVAEDEQLRCAGLASDMVLRVIRDRRAEPRDDLISKMIAASFTDENGQPSQLGDEQILSLSRLLLLAGGGTTHRQLGITLLALLTNRDQLEDVRADRSLVGAAIQESLRWNANDPLFFRLATADGEIEGEEIPAGTIVDVCLGAANRDPRRWDNPDAYDIHRPQKRHLGFAAGPHSCLGRLVAEAEMGIAINALLDRLPNLRLDPDYDRPRIVGGIEARGVDHLRVRFG
jgi:cytochrome P450